MVAASALASSLETRPVFLFTVGGRGFDIGRGRQVGSAGLAASGGFSSAKPTVGKAAQSRPKSAKRTTVRMRSLYFADSLRGNAV